MKKRQGSLTIVVRRGRIDVYAPVASEDFEPVLERIRAGDWQSVDAALLKTLLARLAVQFSQHDEAGAPAAKECLALLVGALKGPTGRRRKGFSREQARKTVRALNAMLSTKVRRLRVPR